MGPGAEVELLRAGLRREDVVQDRIRVEEVDRRPHEHGQDVGREDQVLLVDLRVFLGGGERLAGDRADVDDGVGAIANAFAGDLSVQVTGGGRPGHGQNHQGQDSFFAWL